MRESSIEKALVSAVHKHGGWCLKFISPGCDGVPDRILLFPGGRVGFVEVKAPGRKPRPLQLVVMDRLRRFGFPVWVLDTMASIPAIIAHFAEGGRFKGGGEL